MSKILFSMALALSGLTAIAGTKQVIDKQPSGASGTVEVKANVVRKVSLSITDTGANDLVGPTGIDFGTVDADGTPGKLPGSIVGDHAEYTGDFIFSASRSGNGNVTLTAERSVAGNFNVANGVTIEDANGVVQPLSGAGGAITVINNRPKGDFTKKLGISVHSSDVGVLTTTLRFTLSAL